MAWCRRDASRLRALLSRAAFCRDDKNQAAPAFLLY